MKPRQRSAKPRRHSDDRGRLAIVGYAYRFPSAPGEDFWTSLCEGRNLIGTVDASRWAIDTFLHPRESEPASGYTRAGGSIGDVTGFDAAFFGISPREAAQLDPQQRLLLELTWEALESSGIRPSTLRGSRSSVLVGLSSADYGLRSTDDMAIQDAFSLTGNTASISANRISYAFDLRGASMSVDTACSSSLVAFHQACASIHAGEADLAIAGAVNLHLHPIAYIAFSKGSMLSRQGLCRSFDAGGDGYVRSEGGAIMVLKPLDKALADGNLIHAVVAGSALNSDGRTNGLTVPSAKAQAALLEEVYARAGIDPSDIDYLEAHGTGTPVGDPIEAWALGESLGRKRPAASPLRIGSVKSNLGHLETASGMAGLVKALLCLKHRAIPRSLHFETPNPHIDFADRNLEVVTRQTPLPARKRLVIGINSFGFGGANAHVILESHQGKTPRPRKAGTKERKERLAPLFLSARSAGALKASAIAHAQLLRERQDLALYDVAYSAAFHRDWHGHRAMVHGGDRDAAIQALEAFGAGAASRNVALGRSLPRARGPVFVYTGNGSQWAGMGGALLVESPVFSDAILELDRIIQKYSDVSVLRVLASDPAEQRLDATEIAQPVLFALQVGLTKLLASHGLRPSAVIGHSVGEMAAAWASGALSLDHAAFLVCERSAWQATTRGLGGMTAVELGAADMAQLLERDGLRASIAAVNGPRSITVSGSLQDLAALEAVLQARGASYQRLALDYAFHSPLMDPIRTGIEGALGKLVARPTRIPMYSTVTGALLAGESLDPAYWWRNIRDPVQFAPAVDQLVAAGNSVFVEVGPQPILRRYLGECLNAAVIDGRVIPTMARAGDDAASLRARAFETLMTGVDADLSALFPSQGRFVDLPTYPWQRERHWRDVSGEGLDIIGRQMVHPLLGYRLDRNETQWENHLDTIRLPAYADHKVGGEIVLPAAAYVEMAFAAAAQRDPESACEIEDLEIRDPLVLSDQYSQTVRFVLDPALGSFTIKSRLRLSDDPWRVHAVGRLAAGTSRPEAERRMPPPWSARTPGKRISADAHYQRTSAVGLEYGPAFRMVAEAWREDDGSDAGVGAAIAMSAEHSAEARLAHLHPATLDAAFQMLLHLDDVETAAAIAYIPVRIGRVTLLKPYAEARRASARPRWRGPRSLVAQCVLYDEDGETIALLSDVRFRALPLRRNSLAGLACLHERAVPDPLPAATRAAALPPADSLISACAARLHASARQHIRWRYFNDVEPLLEALLSSFAAAALEQLAPHGDAVSAAQLQRLRRLAGGDQIADPATLWAQMLRDYPDHANEILWIGRLGMRLADIARGIARADDFLPAPDGQHADAWSAAWMPATADYVQAIADIVALSVSSLPHGRRLRVLAINAEHAPAVAQVLSRIDPDRCELVTAGAVCPKEQGAPFDLVIVEDGLASAANREEALRDLRAKIADDGLLVLLERHPSRAVLLAMEFLAPASGQRPRVQPLSVGLWRDELESQGFQHAMVVEDVPGVEASSYLLVARALRAEAATAEPAAGTGAAVKRFVLVTDKSGLSSRLAAGVAVELQKRGQRVDWIPADPHTREGWEALVASASEASGGIDAVVHLCGLADTGQAPKRMLKRQVQRAESLAGLIAACAARTPQLACFAVTARAAVALLPDAVRAGLHLEASLDDAAYWGFARTAMNEYQGLPLRLVDLAAPDPEQCAAALADALLAPDAEDEVILTPSGRYVLRVHSTPFSRHAAGETRGPSLLRLENPSPGQLKNLRWTRRPLRALAEGEVAIDVRAAGLNFRDVMYAMGQLPDEALEGGFAGPTLGMEIAGVVAEVGKGVRGLARGDEVLAFSPSGFATRAITRASAVMKKPAAWSFEAAATVQTTFFTAHYALHHLARLGRGERVLIHGAAGGVGLAAIQIAQQKGAEIFATAGSEAKRDLLRLLGVQHVLDSRSLAFADDILARTGGDGVDVVLNSLAGEAMRRSLQLLRPTGRFLELGKRDYYENTRVGLRPFRNNISYFGVDADQLMVERPEFTRKLMQELLQSFRAGTLHPLPFCAFRADAAVDAFRFMQQSRHIGKVVLTFDSPPHAEAEAGDADAPPPRLALHAEASYLVTGGLGGFGLRTAQWLADRGARHLVLAGRSETPSPEAQAAIAELAARGVNVRAASCDVTDRKALRRLLAEVAESMPPLRGLVHASAVYRDGLVRSMERGDIAAVFAPKLLGANNLHHLTRHLKLDFFVLYSSATTKFGNPGQANYVGANRALEVLAAVRRSAGLPALCVGWGPITDAGYLARNEKLGERVTGRLGGAPFTAAQALDALEALLLDDVSGLAVLRFDPHALSRFAAWAHSPKYQPLVALVGDALPAENSIDDLRRWVAETGETEVVARLSELLKKEVADILRMDAATIDGTAPLAELGLDSLMGVELMTALEARFGVNIPAMAVADAGNLDRLAQRIMKEMKRGQDAPAPAVGFAVEDEVQALAAKLAPDLNAQLVEEITAGVKATER